MRDCNIKQLQGYFKIHWPIHDIRALQTSLDSCCSDMNLLALLFRTTPGAVTREGIVKEGGTFHYGLI